MTSGRRRSVERKTNKEVLIVIVSVIVIILVCYLFIFPSIATLRDVNYNLSLKKEDLKRSEEHLSNLKSLESSLSSKKKEFKALQEAMPGDKSVENLLVTLETAASESGLTLASVTPLDIEGYGEEEEEGATMTSDSGFEISETSYEVGLTGSYNGLKKLLGKLEKTKRAINVTALTVSGTGTIVNPNALNIVLSFTAYYLSQT